MSWENKIQKPLDTTTMQNNKKDNPKSIFHTKVVLAIQDLNDVRIGTIKPIKKTILNAINNGEKTVHIKRNNDKTIKRLQKTRKTLEYYQSNVYKKKKKKNNLDEAKYNIVYDALEYTNKYIKYLMQITSIVDHVKDKLSKQEKQNSTSSSSEETAPKSTSSSSNAQKSPDGEISKIKAIINSLNQQIDSSLK